MTIETAITYGGVILALMPHIAALVGTPAWLGKIVAAQKIYDILSGNYNNAKNAKE